MKQFWLGNFLGLWVALLTAIAPALASEGDEFFENRVRPILANNCYACHTNSELGGLRLDSRESLLKGGNSGPAIIPSDPERSLLIRAVRHVDERLKMTMKEIHRTCVKYGKNGNFVNYLDGANIAGFIKVADAMLDQGVV